jgi:hypothetical protein
MAAYLAAAGTLLLMPEATQCVGTFLIKFRLRFIAPPRDQMRPGASCTCAPPQHASERSDSCASSRLSLHHVLRSSLPQIVVVRLLAISWKGKSVFAPHNSPAFSDLLKSYARAVHGTMVLCNRCAAIDFGLLIERACSEIRTTPGYDILPAYAVAAGTPYGDIRKAALQGCELCDMIQYGLFVVPSPVSHAGGLPLVDDTPIELSLTMEMCHPDLAPSYTQCYSLCASHLIGTSTIRASVTLTLASSNGNSPCVSKQRASWDPALWRSWLEDCVETHEPCKSIDPNRYTPTRLIDMRAGTSGLRLVESYDGFLEYVALSHCWGGSLPLRTTSANLTDHLDAIPWESMPATFRDAVEVTLSLGYRFLWIDCLCIIQDSESDWLRECALMLQIYSCAAVTIAASQSTSPSEGMFKPVGRPSYTCTVPTCWPSTGELDTLIIDLPLHPELCGPDCIAIGPLKDRGWALQERVLSQRVLHICADGTFFECVCCERSDRLPWPKPTAMSSWSLPFSRTLLRMEDPHQILAQWHSLVFHYAQRYLTYAGDRLPAVSGIARLVARRLNQSYVAGLWSEDLVVGLVWRVIYSDSSLALNHSRYTGPSWSWTSGNKFLIYSAFLVYKRHAEDWFQGSESISQLKDHDWAPCLKIQDWSVELAGDDPFAEVKSGQLTILGGIRQVMVKNPANLSERQPLAYTPGRSVNVMYYPDSQGPSTAPDARTAICCLPVGFLKVPNISAYCFMFVIQAVPGRAHTFKRVGSMTIGADQDTVESRDSFHTAVDWFLAAETQLIYLV